ncbi:hypothetical protein BDV40DRAFT_252605 [Aspergillus tamarii]|uniref:Uncharacterized protein n=1 Tax=Aspergillus tamarii TaxID=41984 RepID=A0A5N6V9P0_ASPTM|nr:hypothetical protein BDV40DRAFT_252605 [Aspergillus tamarii]
MAALRSILCTYTQIHAGSTRQTSRRKVSISAFLALYWNYLPVLHAYFVVTCSLIYL